MFCFDVSCVWLNTNNTFEIVSIKVIISLHIRSMWETICDAWACWSGWNFGPNSTEYPYSELDTWYPSPPPNWNLGRSWHFKTFQFWLQNTPPPAENWNLGRSWHFNKTFQFWLQNTPPPPKNWNLGRSWHFKTFQFWLQNRPPPPPENWNLGRSWHFKTFQFWLQNTPPPRKFKFKEDLGTLE